MDMECVGKDRIHIAIPILLGQCFDNNDDDFEEPMKTCSSRVAVPIF